MAQNPEVSGTVRNIGPGAPGMPIGWTHRDGYTHSYMNANGYANPDYSGQCYISFYGFSPMLSGLPATTFYGVNGVSNCNVFVKRFYDYAINNDLSVHDALDQASQSYFGCYYSSSVLYNGYDSYWPGGANDAPLNHAGYYPRDFYPANPKNSMKVYGDSTVHLHQSTITLAGNNGLSPTFNIDGYTYYPGTYYVTPKYHSINVGDIGGYNWQSFHDQDIYGDGYIYYRPVNLLLNRPVTLTAMYQAQANYISTSAIADVAISPTQVSNGNNVISWVCADDYGAYYCHIKNTGVCIDGNWYSPWSFGDDHSGSITFSDYAPHSVYIESEPNTYPVTFNQYAHNDYCGDMLVNSWTEWHVAWEEVGGPHYSHGSDLHGGGGENYYVDSAINDPWGYGTDYFNYAMSHNWGGGSETYYYGIPLNVWTFTWGNTVDIYYNYYG